MPPTPAKTVLDTILDWSNDRPLWQRDALRRIVAKGHQDDDDITELVTLCKIGKGAPTTELKAIPIDKAHLPATPGQGDSVSIQSISDVLGVNNLAAQQTVEFEPSGITIIYGDNGAGKSGYGRILKRACRARHAGKIEPNVYAAELPIPTAKATFTYLVGDALQSPIEWQDNSLPHPTLSAVSVFDRDCSAIHLRGKNEVAFRPFGLDIPDELADVCQRVKDALTAEQKKAEANRHPVFSKPTWQSSTAAGKALTALNHSTDFKKITALGTLSEAEAKRLQQLREDLAKDPKKAADEQTLKADNIKRLHKAVTAIAERTTDTALTNLWTLYQDARTKREAAKVAADTAFALESLEGVGGAVWKQLWEAARRYSTEVSYPGRTYPATEPSDLCVLCQQPLDDDARARLSQFEEFIQKDTERHAQQAETAYKAAYDETAAMRIAIKPMKANLQELKLQNQAMGRKAIRYLASARLRRYSVLRAISTAGTLKLPDSSDSPLPDVTQLEATIRAYAAELLKAATADERQKLVQELAELNDRFLLSQLLPTVNQEIERLKDFYFLGQCITDTATNTITKLGNDIADKQITPKLRDRFQEEIVKLAAEKVRVEIVRSGGKYGSPQYQVRLFAKPDAGVADILSEGEQTCVGLAAFLTELATSSHRSALVFDDPVTSLDHRWRKQVASRLVEEVKQRQIIVFTHDLIFVNDIYTLATDAKLPVRCVTVSRGSAGTGIVAQGLPWQGKSIEDRIDRLEKATREAKTLYDNNQDEDYKREAASIYNNLRASWERALEDVGFFRVVQRHRDYINTKELKKVSVLTEQDCDAFNTGFKKCCDIVDAHDPSSARNAAPPPPTEIATDIQHLSDWVTSLRARQKLIT
jgi:energy-coupling factor transporter ATP-binding protein EcfA2